jgi:hypothetical protein
MVSSLTLSQVVVEVEEVVEQAGQPHEPVGSDCLLEFGDSGLVDTLGVVRRSGE